VLSFILNKIDINEWSFVQKKKKKQYQITRTDPIGFSKNKKRKRKRLKKAMNTHHGYTSHEKKYKLIFFMEHESIFFKFKF